MAYLNRRDAAHERVSTVFGVFSGRMFSTSAVLTEAMHFLGKAQGGPSLLANLVSGSQIVVIEACQPSDLRTAARLMHRYHDSRMDFADATLVMVADVLDVVDIFTLDRSGFTTFRTSAGKPFRLVMD